MKKTRLCTCRILFFVLILCACSVNISEAPQTTPISTAVSSTPSMVISDSTRQNGIGNPLLPITTVPVTWTDLNLTGTLIYINANQDNNGNLILGIRALDLVTGVVKTIFQGPQFSWVHYVTVSPDAKQLVMSYSAPPQDQGPTSQLLYVMPLDGSTQPELLVLPPTIYDQYIQAEWSPDGKYIYYVHFNYQDQPVDQYYPSYEIFRMAYPNGQPEAVAEQAFWPRLSSDSSQLAYISIDPVSGTNKLFLSHADGSNVQEVERSGPWIPDIIDAPIFSPDGGAIFFSAISPTQSYKPNWFEKLLGIQTVEAHSLPSDWWSVPLSGGVVTQLTHIQSPGLFASVSPDKKHIVSSGAIGLFVMNPDGTNLTMLISNLGGITGTVNWLP